MTVFQGIILGVIQGITEFLPISASGHMALAQELLGINLSREEQYVLVLLKAGVLLAVCLVFFGEIINMLREGFLLIKDFIENIFRFFMRIFGSKIKRKKMIRSAHRKMVLMLLVTTIPMGLLGYFIEEYSGINATLFLVSSIFILLNGIFLLLAASAEPGEKRSKQATFRDAFLIGCAEGISALPGISRTGSAMTAGLLCGFEPVFTVRYAFLTSIPALAGSLLYHIKRMEVSSLFSVPVSVYGVGAVSAILTGVISMNLMIFVAKKRGFLPFSIYCILLGLAGIIWNIL